MQFRTLSTFVLAAAVGALAFAGSQALSQEKEPAPKRKPYSADYRDHDPAQSMARYMDTMKAGPQHAALAQFLGEWDTSMTYEMPGMENAPPTPGKATTRWLFEGKWLITEHDSSMMGQPMKSVVIMGYDNFKRKYVNVYLNSLETEMRMSMGNFGKDAKNLFLFGTMNEAMTGEVLKPFGVTMRIKSADEHMIEIHDPSIGDGDTAVIHYTYTRRKQ